MAIAAVVAWLIQTYVLVPLDIVYMQTIVFILVIAALVQMVEIMLKKLSPSLYQALGIFLPLITTNCAVLGDPEGVQPVAERHLFGGHGPRFRPRAGALRRYPRASRFRGRAQGVQGHSHRADHGRDSGHGVYGILRSGLISDL
jgi:hypothetical protein